MFCERCGKEIDDNKKFCVYCGAKQNISGDTPPVSYNYRPDTNRGGNTSALVGIITLCLLLVGITCFAVFNTEEINKSPMPTPATDSTPVSMTPAQTLNKIDEYQARYFEIIKRHDMFLHIYSGEEDYAKKDDDDYNALYTEVEKQIVKNNFYVKKYYQTIKQYRECDGMTTNDMMYAASQNYKAIDKLLNEVYQEVRGIIPAEDFENLKQSEIRWIKDVDKYHKKATSEDGEYMYGSYGSRAGIMNAEVDMRQFRTMLLLLYLK